LDRTSSKEFREDGPRVVVIVPTKNHAMSIMSVFNKFGKPL